MADQATQPIPSTTIGLAGASGFVGTHLIEHLRSDFRIRALTRSANVVTAQSAEEAIEWRECDLYSLPKVTEALEGCDVGIYLVHSMAPSSRLVQSRFEDTDLLLADNFIRAAEAAGVKHVIPLWTLQALGGLFWECAACAGRPAAGKPAIRSGSAAECLAAAFARALHSVWSVVSEKCGRAGQPQAQPAQFDACCRSCLHQTGPARALGAADALSSGLVGPSSGRRIWTMADELLLQQNQVRAAVLRRLRLGKPGS